MMHIQLARMVLFLLLSGFALAGDENSKQGDLVRANWLAGHWQGNGFGGTSEEVWSTPVNGVMMGMFRLHNAQGELVFYEFMTIDHEGLKLKHFNADLTGWETKDEHLTFNLVEVTANSLAFKDLEYKLTSDTTMEVHLVMHDEGKTRTEVFSMRRQTP
jgi:hypothetical protein